MHSVIVSGDGLTIDDLVAVARHRTPVQLSGDSSIQERILASCQLVEQAVAEERPIYGVNTGFGGMSHVAIAPAEVANLQANLLCFLRAGCGGRLSDPDVRSAMLLRVNSLARGVSGVRPALIERLICFINQDITPHVLDLGSIGASGDLIPLSYVAGALVGASDDYLVDFRGTTLGAASALNRLGLAPLTLAPKEGLALINGTSMLTGIAAGCLYDSERSLELSMVAHALILQALSASDEPFLAFIHEQKPHPGQRRAAERMRFLLSGSKLIRTKVGDGRDSVANRLVQDRYSIRCLPQFMGPILDGMTTIHHQIEVEMNSATDNPLFDCETGVSFHGGNFLGEYIAVGMDQCRYYLGLIAKHLDVQIAMLMEPSFSGGLSGSLVGNPHRSVNMGLKGLQIAGNSIMPLIGFYGNSLADRFPTHAEQFNQNINSQGFGSALLTRRSVELAEQLLAIALIVGVQAVELRTRMMGGSFDAREFLSATTAPAYEAVHTLLGKEIDPGRPLVFNDDEQLLDRWIAAIVADIRGKGRLLQAIA